MTSALPHHPNVLGLEHNVCPFSHLDLDCIAAWGMAAG